MDSFNNYPMKWYKALVYILLPISLIGEAADLITMLIKLSFGDIIALLHIDTIEETVFFHLTTTHVLFSGILEVLSLAASVLLFFAWYNLFKRKKQGIKQFLIYLLANGVISTLSTVLIGTVHYELKAYPYVWITQEILIISMVLSVVLSLGLSIFFYYLNRVYFKKREQFFE